MRSRYIFRQCYRCGKMTRFIVPPMGHNGKPHFAYWHCANCGKWNRTLDINTD